LNIYTLVEGEIGAKNIYKEWISYVNPTLTYVNHISEVIENNLLIVAGYGYPFYKQIIEHAVEDVNNNGLFNRPVISVDSEDNTYQEKLDEIKSFINHLHDDIELRIVIQHFCLETWALGNRKIHSRSISNKKLKEYKKIYDVHKNDPELLPSNDKSELNRSQFAYHYLRALLNEKNRNLTYTKSNTKAITSEPYFSQIKKRYQKTNHIKSFENFLTAFI